MSNSNLPRVSVKVPAKERGVTVRVKPPESRLYLMVTSEGEALEVKVCPEGLRVEVFVLPLDDFSELTLDGGPQGDPHGAPDGGQYPAGPDQTPSPPTSDLIARPPTKAESSLIVVESGDLDVFKEITGSSTTLLAMKLSDASAEELSRETSGEFDFGLQSELPPDGLPVSEGGLPQLDGVEPDAHPHPDGVEPDGYPYSDLETGSQAEPDISEFYPDTSQKGLLDPTSPVLLKYTQTQALLAQLPDLEPMAKADDDSRLGTAVNSIVAALTDSVQGTEALFDSPPDAPSGASLDSPQDQVPVSYRSPAPGSTLAQPVARRILEGSLDLTIDHFIASQLTDEAGVPKNATPDAEASESDATEGAAPEGAAPEETGPEKPAPVETPQPTPADTFFCEPVPFEPAPEAALAPESRQQAPAAPGEPNLDDDDDIIDGEPLGDNPEATAEALYAPATPLDQAPAPELKAQESQSPPKREPEPLAAQSPVEEASVDGVAPSDEALAEGETPPEEAPTGEAAQGHEGVQSDEPPAEQELPGDDALTMDGYRLDPNAPDELDDETPAIFDQPEEGRAELVYFGESYVPAASAPLDEIGEGSKGVTPPQGQGFEEPLENDRPTEGQELEEPGATAETAEAGEPGATAEPAKLADLGVFGELSRDEDSGPDPEATDEHLAALDDPNYDPVNDPAGTRARTEPLTYIPELGASAGSLLASSQSALLSAEIPAAELPMAEAPAPEPGPVGEPMGEPGSEPGPSAEGSAEGGDDFDTEGLDFSGELEPSLEPQIATNIPAALPPMILYSPPRPVPKIISPEASTAVIVNYLEDTDDNMLASQGKVDELAEDEDMDIDLMDMHSQEPVRLEAKPMIPVPKSPV